MTLISFVVPAYRVQGYLRECLDSVLDQPVRDIELIGVDDGSPDGSGDILTEYARRDQRVQAIRLPHNVGLGPARNAGLDRATGEYVWFLDGDDTLAEGCLAEVVDRLRDTHPDVLVVDHVRAHWAGWTSRSAMAEVLPVPPGPTTFTLVDRPELIRLLHTAWNKVIRRSFLTEQALRFAPGWYEDVSFTYPVLMAARRIGVLDRVCVNYRQRRHGAITRTVDRRHFDVFTQWHRVFDLLDRSRADGLRPALFERMIWHYLTVLGNGERLPPALRPAFFAQMVADYRRWLPVGGYPVPPGTEGLKHRLVATDRWATFSALRVAEQTRQTVGRWSRRALVTAGRPAKRSARRGRDLLLLEYYRAQLRQPIDPNLAVYAAYWYRGYACNPAAIYEKARELAPQVRGVWVVRRDRVESLPPGLEYVVAGTAAYYRALARARWLVNNVNFPDFVVKRPGSVHLQTHHGTPVKVMGLDQQRYPLGAHGLDFPKLLRRIDRWDYSISANRFSTEMWERAYPADYLPLEVGYPRNDRLVNATAVEVEAARARFGAVPGDRIVLYAPTHREYLPGYRPPFDPYALLGVLGPDARLLVRGHYLQPDTGARLVTTGGVPAAPLDGRQAAAVGPGEVPDLAPPPGEAGEAGEGAIRVDEGDVLPEGPSVGVPGPAEVAPDGTSTPVSGPVEVTPDGAVPDGPVLAGMAPTGSVPPWDRVFDVTRHDSVEELYLATDVLVTDYSSAMFDYATLDRPVVVYAPDWDAYRLARGVYLDVTAEPPGAVARSFPQLLEVFATGTETNAEATAARAAFRRRFCAWDDGRAAERVVRRVFLGDQDGAPPGDS